MSNDFVSEFCRYSGRFPTNFSMNSFICCSVGWNTAHTLSSIAVMMILKDSLNVMSASSSDRKKKISPSVRSSSPLRFSTAIIRYLVKTIATCAVSASYERLWHSPTRFRYDLQVLKKTSICHLFPYIRMISSSERAGFVQIRAIQSFLLLLFRTQTIRAGIFCSLPTITSTEEEERYARGI